MGFRGRLGAVWCQDGASWGWRIGLRDRASGRLNAFNSSRLMRIQLNAFNSSHALRTRSPARVPHARSRVKYSPGPPTHSAVLAYGTDTRSLVKNVDAKKPGHFCPGWSITRPRPILRIHRQDTPMFLQSSTGLQYFLRQTSPAVLAIPRGLQIG